MVGTTLAEIREHVEALAADEGAYVVVCGRTGERPIPTAGLRFPSRAVAARATAAAEQYRAALRRYDPRLPHYDLIVTEAVESTDSAGEESGRTRGSVEAVGGDRFAERRAEVGRSPLVEFCHRVAAAVFETLCESGFRSVETAVMDVYFELAEAVQNPDELSLCLLESMASELAHRLTPTEQVEVLTEAASRLPQVESDAEPLAATMRTLVDCGLCAGYERSPPVAGSAGEARSVVVRISEYALSPRHDRLPVLPIVLELYRRDPDWSLSSVSVERAGDGWRLTLVRGIDGEPTGLAGAPFERAG